MKKIKVYLQYPWKFPDSPYYKYLIENPPKNIEYVNAENQKGVITNKSKFLFSNKLKRYIRDSFNFMNFSIPNAYFTKTNEKYDLIHCAHCLSKNEDTPWVADFEGIWQFYIGKKNNKTIEKIRKILTSNRCKKIMPWTETTANEIIKEFPEIKNKVEVIYPAVPVQKFGKKESEKITILYATRYFWLKGGLIALEVYRKLNKVYGNKIELIFISDVPKDVKKRYPEIKIRGLVPKKELYEYYKKADVFFYPSFVDTFGFGLLEAMSFRLPVITVNTKYTKTRKEIIENGKNGFIFDINKDANYYGISNNEQKVIDRLVKNLERLIKNRKLREKMSRNCIDIIKNGKFSIKERNKKLRKTYEEALK